VSVARPWIKRAVILGVIVLVGVVIWSSGDSELIIFGKNPSYPHEIQVTVPEAFEAIPGERITEGGIGVGTILSTNVTRNAEAHIVMGVSNGAWPIPRDSTMYLRMGGTVKFTDRYIQIDPGHGRTYFPNRASVPAKQFVVPVEYDTIFNVFNSRTRAALKQFFDNAGATFAAAEPNFRKALNVAAPAVGQADAVFKDLGYNQQALSTLVRSSAQLVDAVQTSNPGVKTLLGGAGQTFGSVASESTSLQRAITAAPPALAAAGNAARHISRSLTYVSTLAKRLSPGVTQLSELAHPLNDTLGELVNIEPTAVATLDTVKQSGPSLDALLSTARTKLLPQAQAVGSQLATELDCVRPYTPDIVGFFSTWGGFLGDGLTSPHVHFFHGAVGPLAFPNQSPIDTEQMAQLFPALKNSYFPQVPGESWNQPWFQPQCNLTPESTSPANDSENHTYDPYGGKDIDYGPTTS
jgi:phospholipid/cholesterol/gamma-HCH transport system substrate-binding protein